MPKKKDNTQRWNDIWCVKSKSTAHNRAVVVATQQPNTASNTIRCFNAIHRQDAKPVFWEHLWPKKASNSAMTTIPTTKTTIHSFRRSFTQLVFFVCFVFIQLFLFFLSINSDCPFYWLACLSIDVQIEYQLCALFALRFASFHLHHHHHRR